MGLIQVPPATGELLVGKPRTVITNSITDDTLTTVVEVTGTSGVLGQIQAGIKSDGSTTIDFDLIVTIDSKSETMTASYSNSAITYIDFLCWAGTYGGSSPEYRREAIVAPIKFNNSFKVQIQKHHATIGTIEGRVHYRLPMGVA